MNIIKSILTKNPCYTSGKTIIVKGLMLHSVGCSQPNAQVFVKGWNSANHDSSCVHAFIDGNTGDIYQTLPWNHRGWHGGGSSNNTHIGVEMCEPDCIKYTSGASFICSDPSKAKEIVKRTYDSAVELFAYLCKEYNLDPLAKGVIVSHNEGHSLGIASGHSDPEHLWNCLGIGFTMDGFRQDVKSKMGVIDTTTPEPSESSKKSADEVAKEVINGLWGNGDERKRKLVQAGYDYSEVQNKVNEILEPTSTPQLKSNEEIAKEVIQGLWGNGQNRKVRLKNAGYDYNAIQTLVNKML